MRVSRSLFQRAFVLVVVLFLAACGGSGSDTVPSTSLTASIKIAATAPIGSVVTLDGSGSSTVGGTGPTYNWVLTSKPAGSAATIVNPTTSEPTLTPDVAGTYAVTLTVNDGSKSTSASGSFTASAATFTTPTILTDVVEPLSGSVTLSLANDPGESLITWIVDGVTLGTGTTIVWDTTTVANGSHVVIARLTFAANYTIDVTRTVQVAQTTVDFVTPTVYESVGQFTAIVGVVSPNGVLRVSATFDGAPFGVLAVPNACYDPTGVACATGGGLNGFAFGGATVNGAHVVVVTATDGVGNTLTIQLRFTVSDASS